MIVGLTGDYETKLHESNMTTLKDRRERGDVIQAFKIIRRVSDVDYSICFKFESEVNIRDSRSVSEAK